jgi:hypothetical protein
VDQRKLISEIVEKCGIRLDPNDPAFILVELNKLVLDEYVNKIAPQLSRATDRFEAVTIRNVDDFVNVANEALSKFIQRTNELKTTLDALERAGQGVTHTTTASALSVALESKYNFGFSHALWWIIPVVLSIGILIGSALSLFLK